MKNTHLREINDLSPKVRTLRTTSFELRRGTLTNVYGPQTQLRTLLRKTHSIVFFVRFYSLLFAKELRKHSYTREVTRSLYEYCKPFLVYIAQVNGLNCLADMEHNHIQDYCCTICKGITSESSFFETMHVNKKLTAVRMLCIYMHLYGVVSVNHAKEVPFISPPNVAAQNTH